MEPAFRGWCISRRRTKCRNLGNLLFERNFTMKTKRHMLAILLALALLVLPTTVFAKELGLLIITGPGIKGDVTVSEQSVLMKLEGSGFFDQSNRLKQAPENLGEGYAITSHLNLDGTMTPFIEMMYYPVEEGQPGYINVIGRLDGTSLRKVDEWSQLPAEADNFFRTVMAAQKVTLQSAIIAEPAAVAPVAVAPQTNSEAEPAVVPQGQPEVQPASAPVRTSVRLPYPALALATLLLVLFGAALMFRRRAVSQGSA
jgi:hypothetical protein